MLGRLISCFLLHHIYFLLFFHFRKNLIPYSPNLSDWLLWKLAVSSNTLVIILNLFNLFLVLSFINTNFNLQFSFIILLLDFFNLIPKHFSALTCDWGLIAFVGYLTLRTAFFLVGTASCACAVAFSVSFLRNQLSRCETIDMLVWRKFWLKPEDHLSWYIEWFLLWTSFFRNVGHQICWILEWNLPFWIGLLARQTVI